MNFYKYSFKDPLKIKQFWDTRAYKIQNKIIPDLIFVPLVGYDNNLNRLGYGGGFYDRYFEKILEKKK